MTVNSWSGGPPDYALVRYVELDSTNEEARRLAAAGTAGPLWISTARQTAGRGRHGRSWESLSGNLAATLLLTPARPLADWPQLSFAAAIATADMVAGFAPGAEIAVKWPNDVLAAPAQSARTRNGPEQDCASTKEYQKIAGILLERVGERLAIGIGVNLASFPGATETPAISLAALGVLAPAPEAALTALAGHFAKWYGVWAERGFAPLREAWLARAAGLGARIRARLPDKEWSGLFEGIDESGALLLNQDGKVRAIAAGEVFF